MLRHQKQKHTSESDSEAMDSSDMSTNETEHDNVSEDENTDGNSSCNEEYEDPWDKLIEETFSVLQKEYEQSVLTYVKAEDVNSDVARINIFREMRGQYRKVLKKNFCESILWINALLDDPIYKSIKKTALGLKKLNNSDDEEAWKSAINSRKYLLEKVLNRYEPPEIVHSNAKEQRGGANIDLSSAYPTETPMQKVDKWVKSELDDISNKPGVSIIGRRGGCFK